MAEVSLSILELAGRFLNKPFEPDFDDVPSAAGTVKRTEKGAVAGADYYGIDKTGREFYMPVVLQYAVDGATQTISLPNPVVSFQSRKRVVETPLTHRDGTVKELISIEGFQITVRGYLIGDRGEFPEKELTQLVELHRQKVSVEIQNVITDVLLKTKDKKAEVVIMELRVPERRGVKGVREYELLMVNDEPFNLEEI